MAGPSTNTASSGGSTWRGQANGGARATTLARIQRRHQDAGHEHQGDEVEPQALLEIERIQAPQA